MTPAPPDGISDGGSNESRATRELELLPLSTRLKLDPGTRLVPGHNGTWVVIGGSPYVMLTLKAGAAAVIESLQSGHDIARAAKAAGVSHAAAQRLARKFIATGLAEPLFSTVARYSATDITAVVPVLNEEAAIGPLILSLREAGIRNLLVVDDGSTDATVRNARSAGAIVLHTPGRVGPGPARNTALDQVTTPLVLFIDADVLPNGDWLSPHLLAFADPAVAAVAPRVRSHNSASGLIDRYEAIRSPLDLGTRRASVRPRSRVAYVPTAALLADVGVVRGLGGFDPALRTGEDVDLVWRMARSGRVVRYEPAAEVFHRPRATIAAFIQQRRSYGQSAAALDIRHRRQVAPVAASGWSVLAWSLAMLGGPVGVGGAAAAAVGTSALLERKLRSIANPRKLAWSLAMRGHWGVGRQLASALWRAWLPFALASCMFSRRARIAVVAAGVLPNAAEWRERRPSIDPARFIAMRLIDDASYCAGVWEGSLRHRHFGALLPYLANWPGKRTESRVD